MVNARGCSRDGMTSFFFSSPRNVEFICKNETSSALSEKVRGSDSIRLTSGTFQLLRGVQPLSRRLDSRKRRNRAQGWFWKKLSCNHAHDHRGRKIPRLFSEPKKSVLHGERISCMHTSPDNMIIPSVWKSWKNLISIPNLTLAPQKSNVSPLGIDLSLGNLQVKF